MKIRFKEAVGGPSISVRDGEIKDLPIPDAKYWINIGLAEAVEEPKQREVKVQRVKKAATR